VQWFTQSTCTENYRTLGHAKATKSKDDGNEVPEKAPARKVARMELRLTVASKRIIEQAVSISAYPRDLTYEAARRVLQDHERLS